MQWSTERHRIYNIKAVKSLTKPISHAMEHRIYNIKASKNTNRSHHFTYNGAQNLKYEGGKKKLKNPISHAMGNKITVDQPKKT